MEFRIIGDEEQLTFIKGLAEKAGLKHRPEYIVARLGLNRNHRNEKMFKVEGLDKLYDAYLQRLIKKNSIDLDGLLSLCLGTLTNDSRALETCRSQYKYILVDEFQDITLLQYEVIKVLAQDSGNLLCIGDFDQSIYGFRGADVNIMLNLKSDFPNCKQYFLEQNYRSTKQIVNVANELIKNNRHREEKPHWTHRLEGLPPHIEGFANPDREAQFAASRILEGVVKGGSFSDYGVLYRIHSMNEVLEATFFEQGIPYQVMNNVNDFLRLEKSAPMGKENDDSVKLLTIHSAKGLQFPTVFIVGVTDRMLPYYKSTFPLDKEEERRLLYVAITRAEDHLYITYPEYDGRDYKDPSPFISELDQPATPSKANKSLEKLQKGSSIEHKKFGVGTVIAVRKDHQGDALIKVKFKKEGIKDILLKHAPIKIVE